MDTEDPEFPPPHGTAPDSAPDSAAGEPDRAWFGRRKRVVARDVTLAPRQATHAVQREMKSAALGMLTPSDVIDVPRTPLAPPSELVLDPTLFSERHRKHGQNAAYRVTQAMLILALLAAPAAIVFALLEEPTLARILAAAASGFAVLSVWLVRRSRLARRLRGYAAGACALAGIAVVVSLLPIPSHDEGKPPARDKPGATAGA